MTLAHGGFGGAVLEAVLLVAILAIFLMVWLRERRAGRPRSDDEA